RVQEVVDSLLLQYELAVEVEVALYQEKTHGHFLSLEPESEAWLRASYIRACLTCIVSFYTLKSGDRLPEESESDFTRRLREGSEFQYFSPLDRQTDDPEEILWLALYQTKAESAAFRQLRSVFAVNIGLLAVLLGLFGWLLRALYRYKQLGQAKDDLFSNLTHEFKTPLSSIRLASRMLARPLPEEKQQTYRQIIEQESAELERQVDQLLHVSLLDQAAIPLQKERVKLVALLEQLERSFSARLEARQAHLEFDMSDPDLEVFADRDHVFRSLSNLIDNSLKYGQEGIVIQISAKQLGEQVELRIRDNGPGISSEHRDHIFERFYRGQKQNQYKGKGFGIGLSYVKSVVEAHGGSIDLNSQFKKGTEFILQL
ncbi:MAG: HAMP domain-containing sensor histidine kinase, partial [Bacteroidota bacterium]